MSTFAHTIPELDEKGLREFGLVTGGIVAVLFGLVLPWLFDLNFPLWPWIVAGVLGTWALVAPSTLRTLYQFWMRLGLLLSRVTTPLILGIVYFVLILPVALVMRLIGRDPMARKLDSQVPSYRVQSRKPSRNHMERPF